MDAAERAEAEFILQDALRDALPSNLYEIHAQQRERVGRWLAYQEAVISGIEWAATEYAADPVLALASIRGKLQEYERAAERLGQTLDADAAIPR